MVWNYKFCAALLTVFFLNLQSLYAESLGEHFSKFDNESKIQIDHSPWSKFLVTAVYDVGRSDRIPAKKKGTIRKTGTRVTTACDSKYRHEGNRALFQFFDEGSILYVQQYRDGLQAAIEKVGYATLNRDEQLAFWLNLYNVVLVHEIAKAHPIARPHTIKPSHLNKSGKQKVSLFDAKVVSVHGQELSLNEIRKEIVFKNWKNPNVIYGFWQGTIGGPSLQLDAFTGGNVQSLLKRSGGEFVNSLRGVNRSTGALRISKHYDDARILFPVWPKDVVSHIYSHADLITAGLLGDSADEPIKATISDLHTADLESGETRRFSGSNNPASIANDRTFSGLRAKIDKGATSRLSPDAFVFLERIEQKKKSRTGTVTIDDIENEDIDNKEQTESSVDDIETLD